MVGSGVGVSVGSAVGLGVAVGSGMVGVSVSVGVAVGVGVDVSVRVDVAFRQRCRNADGNRLCRCLLCFLTAVRHRCQRTGGNQQQQQEAAQGKCFRHMKPFLYRIPGNRKQEGSKQQQ